MKKALFLPITLTCLLWMPTPIRAALPVVDFSNLTQSILQVTHAVTQIQNQIQQINQMAQTLQTLGGSQYAPITQGLDNQLGSVSTKLS